MERIVSPSNEIRVALVTIFYLSDIGPTIYLR